MRGKINLKTMLICSIIILLISLLSACGEHRQPKPKDKLFVVKAKEVHSSLLFSGTIQPLHESAITSPLDAIIETMYSHYGQYVKKGEVIMVLNSHELQKQYNDILTDYLKSKDNYTIASEKFTGSQTLWDAGLLSKNNYLSEKSSFDMARMNLIQSTRKLSEMLENMDDKATLNLSSLNIAEFDKVRQALTSTHRLIRLKAPTKGVLLYPPKTSDDKGNKLSVGSVVKANQVIGMVGDLSGIRVEIEVPEVDLAKIHPGMAVTITGVAFGQQVLHGELVAVDAQARNTNDNNLPSFNATVEVKHLTPEQSALIKVGMSAAIAITTANPDKLLIPIAALKQENGHSVVTVQAKDGSRHTQTVSTGSAQADQVIITAGLKPQDVVVYL